MEFVKAFSAISLLISPSTAFISHGITSSVVHKPPPAAKYIMIYATA